MTMFLWELQDLSAGVQVQLLFLIGVHIMTPLKKSAYCRQHALMKFSGRLQTGMKVVSSIMSYILYLIQNLMWKNYS